MFNLRLRCISEDVITSGVMERRTEVDSYCITKEVEGFCSRNTREECSLSW